MFSKILDLILSKLSTWKIITSNIYKRSQSQLKIQDEKFSEWNFDRKQAISKIDTVLQELYQENYSENNGMWSEHLVIMAAISSQPNEIRNILEIGTFDGQTARILSKLFPESEITTIDLPQNIVDTKEIYKYAHEGNKLQSQRINNLKGCSNVRFVEINSLSLINENSKFDLIWVDGAHGYPIVAIDLINSLRIVTPHGYVMCDDVYDFTYSNDSEYRSTGANETLIALSEAGMIKYQLFLKRINRIYNYPKFRKKSVGVFQKL
jgi:predicted O-methyltransferase YrrM